MSFTVSYGCLLSLTVSPIPWSCYMSLTVSHGCLLSLTVSTVSWIAACLSLSPMVAGCFSGPIELLHVSHCLAWLLAVSHSLSKYDGVAECLSLSIMVAMCLSLSLRSHGVATSLNVTHC